MFILKIKIAGRAGNDGPKNVKIRVPLKYLSSLFKTPEIPLIYSETNLILTLSQRYFITDAPIVGKEPRFTLTDTKLYVPFVTLSTQDNARLLEQLKSGFKRTVN